MCLQKKPKPIGGASASLDKGAPSSALKSPTGVHIGLICNQVSAFEQGNQHIENNQHAFFLISCQVADGAVAA